MVEIIKQDIKVYDVECGLCSSKLRYEGEELRNVPSTQGYSIFGISCPRCDGIMDSFYLETHRVDPFSPSKKGLWERIFGR